LFSEGFVDDPAVPAEGGLTAETKTESLKVTVVICTYTEQRWSDLGSAINSIREQAVPAVQCILVVDHNPDLFRRARSSFTDIEVVANGSTRGLAGARNTGVKAAIGDVVVFLDDDARADPDWLAELIRPYSNPLVMGTGGSIRPLWRHRRPGWFPDEFAWVVGCSYAGLPDEIAPIRNPIGAGMSFRRSVFEAVGGFSDSMGRIASLPLGCEETELGIRVNQQIAGALVLYVPKAVVHHAVGKERATPWYFVRRCYAEGLSKSLVTQRVGRKDGLSAERDYVTKTLPAGVFREVRRGWRGDTSGILAAVLMVLGLAATAWGYVVGSARDRLGKAKDHVGSREHEGGTG
jgi:GT2 family glycosyltransferase